MKNKVPSSQGRENKRQMACAVILAGDNVLFPKNGSQEGRALSLLFAEYSGDRGKIKVLREAYKALSVDFRTVASFQTIEIGAEQFPTHNITGNFTLSAVKARVIPNSDTAISVLKNFEGIPRDAIANHPSIDGLSKKACELALAPRKK